LRSYSSAQNLPPERCGNSLKNHQRKSFSEIRWSIDDLVPVSTRAIEADLSRLAMLLPAAKIRRDICVPKLMQRMKPLIFSPETDNL
jgi:hypothetical protein